VELKIFLAGRVAVEAYGVLVDEERFPGRQGRLLFAYLVAEQGRPVPRDELAEALWGEAPPATWEKALTVIASKLRGLLTECGLDGGSALTSAFGCYRLELPQGSWVDVIAAASAAKEAEAAAAAGDLQQAKAAAMQAASLARPPFLPGEEGEWVDGKRRELADVRGRALACLAEACLRLGELSEAAKWAEETIALEPYRETGYRFLMNAHAMAGNRAEALRVYERCRRLLAEELGAYPSPETESIYRELLGAASPEAGAAAAVMAPVAVLASEPEEEAAAPTPVWPTRGDRIPIVIGAALVLATASIVAIVELRGGKSSPGLTSVGANSVAVIDPTTSRLVADVLVGNGPTKIAFGEGAAWVINADDETVERIDPATSTVRQTVKVGSGPTSVVVGAGAVWVANGLDGTVSRIDPKTNTVVQKIPVGNGPSGIAVGEGSVWVVNRDDHTLSRIDPRSGKVVRTLDAGTDPVDVAVGARAVWVTNESTGKVVKIDPASTRILDTVNVGRSPRAVTAGAGAVWVANGLDGTVSRVDPSAAVVTHTIPVGEGPSGLSVGLGSVWVSSEFGRSISRIDPARNVLTRSIRIGGRLAGIAASPAGIFVAVRPSGGAHRGGTFTALVFGTQVDSIDPATSFDTMTSGLLSLAYDGLTSFKRVGGSEGTQLVPDLAALVPQPTNGGKSYTFRLRPGVRYSTGEPVRPEDFRRALERTFALRGPGAYFYLRIKGAAACVRRPARCDLSGGIVADARARTVTFHLIEPDPELLYKLALPEAFAVPRSAARQPAGRDPLPGTGPYVIAGYVPGRRLRFVRNSRFHTWSNAARPSGYPDELVFEYGVPPASQLRAVTRGVADYAYAPPLEKLAPLEPRYASRVHSNARLGVWYVFLNTRLPPFDDVRVRRAVNYAVDRRAFARAAGGPLGGEPTCQILPPSFPGYRRYCPYRHDLAKARRLVARAGTRGTDVVVWATRRSVFMVRPVVSAPRALGYRAQAKVADYHTWDYDTMQAGVHSWFADYPAASDFAPLFSCRSAGVATMNPAQFCDPAVERMIERALDLVATDPQAANGLWARIDRMVTDRAPYVPQMNPRRVEYVSVRVGNYQFNPQFGTLFDQLWVR
jgi:peptide/nickel transport system substrate-binding protein